MRTLILFLLGACSSGQAVESSGPAPMPGGGFLPKAVASLAEFQTEWDKVKSFRAAYEQSVSSKIIPGEPDKTVGRLSLIKPDRLRWESETDGSLHILKRTTLTTVRKNSRGTNEVEIQSKVNTADAKALSLLTGRLTLAKLYKPRVVKSTGKTLVLELAEKAPNGEKYEVTLAVPEQTILAIQTDTEDSTTRIEFSKHELNPSLKDSDFTFTPGKDDIVSKH